MEIQELIDLLKNPQVQDVVKAIIKSHNADDKSDADAAESDAGVTDADKTASDDAKPAMLRAALRIGRAFKRQASELIATEKTALLAEAKSSGEASATALLGKSGYVKPSTGDDDANKTAVAKFNAKVTELTAKGVKTAAATLAVMKSDEPLYVAMQRERGIFKN